MLADEEETGAPTGALEPGLHRPRTWIAAVIEFIAGQLPLWRDRPDRRPATSETQLTSQLCGHLNGVARKSAGWDALQFRVEEPDECQIGRRIDLAAAPAGEIIWIEGRRYSDFDPLLPIECKRLPTPVGRDRDKREYLRVSHGSTGGIQRFKAGLHGAAYEQGAMVAYIQSGGIATWIARIDRWIRALARAGASDWRTDDRLQLGWHDPGLKLALLSSQHGRGARLGPIVLSHLWIEV
jgi:hypothetical protein